MTGRTASLLRMCSLTLAYSWYHFLFFSSRMWREKKKRRVLQNLIEISQGLTAHTGHLADNHDVHGITVRNLDQDAKFMDSETVCPIFTTITFF